MPTDTFHAALPLGTPADDHWVKVGSSQWAGCVDDDNTAQRIDTNNNYSDPGESPDFTSWGVGDLATASILSVTAYANVKRDAGGGTFKFRWKTSGSSYTVGDTKTPGTTYADRTQVLTPTGGGAWTYSALSTLALNVYANGDATIDGRNILLNELWISVEYSFGQVLILFN